MLKCTHIYSPNGKDGAGTGSRGTKKRKDRNNKSSKQNNGSNLLQQPALDQDFPQSTTRGFQFLLDKNEQSVTVKLRETLYDLALSSFKSKVSQVFQRNNEQLIRGLNSFINDYDPHSHESTNTSTFKSTQLHTALLFAQHHDLTTLFLHLGGRTDGDGIRNDDTYLHIYPHHAVTIQAMMEYMITGFIGMGGGRKGNNHIDEHNADGRDDEDEGTADGDDKQQEKDEEEEEEENATLLGRKSRKRVNLYSEGAFK